MHVDLCSPRVPNGNLTYHSSMDRLGADEERFVLLAMHQTLVERGCCLRETLRQRLAAEAKFTTRSDA